MKVYQNWLIFLKVTASFLNVWFFPFSVSSYIEKGLRTACKAGLFFLLQEDIVTMHACSLNIYFAVYSPLKLHRTYTWIYFVLLLQSHIFYCTLFFVYVILPSYLLLKLNALKRWWSAIPIIQIFTLSLHRNKHFPSPCKDLWVRQVPTD